MSEQMIEDVDIHIVDNFIVDKKHAPKIDQCLKKIQIIFGVKVEFDNVVKITGESEKQWLKITGGKWDKQSAKEYIIGLCNPEETYPYKCKRAVLNDELMNIEKDTNAVILPTRDKELVISGTQLAVTLALSAVEELMNSSNDVAKESSDVNNHSAVPRDSAASERLASTLQRALSEIGDGTSKCEDYESVPDSVKRVILDCLSHEDVSESDLFDTSAGESSVKFPNEACFGNKLHHTSSGDASTIKTAYASSQLGGLDTDGGAAFQPSSIPYTVSEQEANKKQFGDEHVFDVDYFRKLGISVGYSKEEVEEGFLYLKDSVIPAEFLEILKRIKEEKGKIGIASPSMVVSASSFEETVSDAIIIPDTTAMDSENDDDVVFVSEHFKTPLRPIRPNKKVGGLSVKDKQDVSLQQKQLHKKHGAGLSDKLRQEINVQQKELKELCKKHGSGKEPKGKKEQKASPNAADGQTAQKKTSKSSQLSGKRKQADSSDDDQTCVMEIWQAGNTASCPSDPPQLGIMTATSCTPAPLWPCDASGMPCPLPCLPGNLQRISDDNPIPNLMELSTQPSRQLCINRQLRYIVVDGSNVAMEHGNGRVFSCRGIEICVNYFLTRGHKVTVFVPQWRKYRPSYTNTICDQGILDQLHSRGNLVFTPSRRIQGKTIASYDDRYVLSLAEKEDGIIVSNDQYRDLMLEKQSWRKIVEERLLMFNFVNDHFMPPEDPLGRTGPRLDEFLSKPVSVSRSLQNVPGFQPNGAGLLPLPARTWYELQGVRANPSPLQHWPTPHQAAWQKDGTKPYHQDKPRRDGQPGAARGKGAPRHDVPVRHMKVTEQLFDELKTVFPEKDQEEKIRDVLKNHNTETDLNRLTNYCMSALFP